MTNKIYLLRHGESYHNVAMKQFITDNPDKTCLEWWEIEDSFDPAIRDAALTPNGIEQASTLQGDIRALNPTLLVLSPLTRNLQTADVACQEFLHPSISRSNVTSSDSITDSTSTAVYEVITDVTDSVDVIVTPILREHTYSTCDIGSSPAKLADEWPLWAEKFSGLSESWWAHDEARASDSDKSVYREPWQNLQSRTAELASLLAEQTEKHKCIIVVGHAVLFYALTGNWMANCQLIELNLAKLRPHCSCAGLACRCDMDFDCQAHT